MAKENEIVNENTAQGETREKRFVSPAVDIRESASAYLVTADVPGAHESGIQVTLEKDMLEFTARTSNGEPEDIRGVYREFGDHDYRRSFHLNVDVDRDAVEASVKNGVLRITLPKKQPSVKKVEVKAA